MNAYLSLFGFISCSTSQVIRITRLLPTKVWLILCVLRYIILWRDSVDSIWPIFSTVGYIQPISYSNSLLPRPDKPLFHTYIGKKIVCITLLKYLPYIFLNACFFPKFCIINSVWVSHNLEHYKWIELIKRLKKVTHRSYCFETGLLYYIFT